jgi:hypothetical protein
MFPMLKMVLFGRRLDQYLVSLACRKQVACPINLTLDGVRGLGKLLVRRARTFIVHFFSSTAHVWIPGAKTTGPIVK